MSSASKKVWELFSRGTKIPLGKSFANVRDSDAIEDERSSALQLDTFGQSKSGEQDPYELEMCVHLGVSRQLNDARLPDFVREIDFAEDTVRPVPRKKLTRDRQNQPWHLAD